MFAWHKIMKPIAIGGGVVIGTVLLALAAMAGGCGSRPFAKKMSQQPEAVSTVPLTVENEEKEKSVNRRELDELLSIK